jgi:hypothetical protein
LVRRSTGDSAGLLPTSFRPPAIGFRVSCPPRARCIAFSLVSRCLSPPEFVLGELAKCLSDLVLSVSAAMLVDQRCSGRRVTHPVHKRPQIRSCRGGQIVPCMPEIVEVNLAEVSGGEGRQPYPAAEVLVTEWVALRAGEDER